jgi:CxxC motif-containing protein
MKKNVTCIVCPLGCRIRVTYSKDAINSVKDYQCEKGKDYAVQEIFNPVRNLTTTMEVRNGELPLVSVKTNKPVPKQRIFDVMDSIARIEVEAPISIGDILVENVLDLHADIVATKNVGKTNNKYE